MNKFLKFWILNEEETIFYVFFFFFFTVLLFTLFRQQWKKKALNNIFLFNSNGPQIEYIAKKNKQNTKKKKTKHEGSTNKSTKIFIYFKIF